MGIRYSAGIDTVTKQLCLMGSDERELPFNQPFRFPVATFSTLERDSLPALQIAENIASLLNKRTAPHKITAFPLEIYYSKTETGVFFRTRKSGQEGVSVPAVEMTFPNKGQTAALSQELLHLMDTDFMKKVCDAMGPDHALTVKAPQQGPSGMRF